MASCTTAGARPKTGVVLLDPARIDTPTVSSPEEIEDFSKVDSDPYYLGPGDVLKLKSSNNEFPEEELKVSPDGKVNIASIGEIVLDKTELKVLEKQINERLKKLYANVDAKLVLVSAINRKIALLGAVKTPGIILLEGNMTLVDVIAKAGGFDALAIDAGSTRTKFLCRIIRDNGKTVWIDLRAILFQNASSYNVKVKNNDILFVYRQ